MTARLIIIASLAAALTGCVDNDASVRLFGVCANPAPNSSGGCLYPATACDTLQLGELFVDLTQSESIFELPVQVDNLRPSNADRSGGTETATAWIDEFKVTYAFSDGTTASLKFPSPASHPVVAAGSSTVIIPVIPFALGDALVKRTVSPLDAVGVQMHAEIRALGHYGDQTTFETGPFTVTATVCEGTALASCAGFPLSCPAETPNRAFCPRSGQTSSSACL